MPAKTAAKAPRKAPKPLKVDGEVIERTTGPGRRMTPAEQAKAVALKEQGAQTVDIARALSCSRSTVKDMLKRVDQEAAQVKEYVSKRGDLLAQTQAMIANVEQMVLNSITEQDVNACTATQKATILAQLTTARAINFDKERLERGQSTSNINSLLVVAQRGAMSTLNARLGIPERAPSDLCNTIDAQCVTNGGGTLPIETHREGL